MDQDPKTRVILIDGDGSFNMSHNDLQTVAKYEGRHDRSICHAEII